MNCMELKLTFINPLSLVCLIKEFLAERDKSIVLVDYVFALVILLTIWVSIGLVTYNVIGTKPLFEYSQGKIQGKPVKISKKGVIFKTTEGYLMTGAIVDGSASKWYYSLTDKELENCINNNEEVLLTYKQYLLVPFRVGSTNYIVTECKGL